MSVGKTQTPDLKNMTPQEQRALLERLLQEKATRQRTFPMSVGQQGLWHAYRRDPDATPFNVFMPTRLRSRVELDKFRQTFDVLANRHTCLRTTFSDASGELTQTVQYMLPPEFTLTQMRGASQAEVQVAVVEQATRPFDLEHGPLLRLNLFQIADDDFVVLATVHHIVVDFWSLVLLLGELRQIYPALVAGQAIDLPPAQNNYSTFVSSQAKQLASPEAARWQEYWKQSVGKGTSVVEIPTDRIRPATFTGQAAAQGLAFPAELGAKIHQAAASLRVTPFAILHSALQLLISRFSDQESFFIGSPFSGRALREYEQTFGFFVNMLPIRADLSGEPSFAELARRTGQTLIGAMENEAYPISAIVQDNGIPRDPSRSPLFQVSCTFEKSQLKEEAGRAGFLFPGCTNSWEFGGIRQESFYLPHPTCHYDLEFIFELAGDQLHGMICYCRDLFDPDAMQQLATIFQNLLAAALDSPHIPIAEIPWQNASLAALISETIVDFPDDTPASTHVSSSDTQRAPTVHQQLQSVAAAQPSAIALQTAAGKTSYADLLAQAANLAQQLTASGIGPGDLVPVFCGEGRWAFIAALGVQLSGAACVPIDAAQPAFALDALQQDLDAKAVLTDSETAWSSSASVLEIRVDQQPSVDELAGNSGDPLVSIAAPSDLAYVVYTSGSTGRPKGVMVEHAAVVNTLNWRAAAVPLGASDRVLMLLSHQFDAGLGVAWTTLTQGATLVWADDEARLDPSALIDQIIRDSITVLPAVPSLLKILVAHPRFGECHCLKYLWTGGESMPADLPKEIRSRSQAEFWNFYGPTEAAIEATACELRSHDCSRPIPIGKPISGADILILDAMHRPVPDTAPGEIAIAGRGLARGYLNQPELTAQRFIPHPVDASQGQRVYLTGDRGRQRLDGSIEFFGRTDHQVKVRGYRLELGEIESAIQQHPAVDRASVKVADAGEPSAHLIGFVSLRPVSGLSSDHASSVLREFLAERLPSYKLPRALAIVESMPLTSSGKVDRRQLPDALDAAQLAQQHVRPNGPLEDYLHEVWTGVLEIDELSVDQNFFDAGGSSLQAAMLTTKLTEQLGVRVPTALVFDLASIRQMARRLTELHRDAIHARFGPEPLGEQTAEYSAELASELPSLLSPLKPDGDLPPIFMVHPPGGIVLCYRELAQHLDAGRPLYGIRSRGLHGRETLPESLEAMAAEYVSAIRTVQPEGPYVLGGWSLGGLAAYEMAQQLIAAGEEVQRLVLLDTTIPHQATELVPASERVNVGLEYGIELTLEQLGELSPEEQLPMLFEHAQKLGVLEEDSSPEVVAQMLEDLQELFSHHVQLATDYRMHPLASDILLFRPSETPCKIEVAHDRGWGHVASSVEVAMVTGHHHSMVQLPHVADLARILDRALTPEQPSVASK